MTYGIDDLVAALVEQERDQRSAEPLRAFSGGRAGAFTQAFGVGAPVKPSSWTAILDSTIRTLSRLGTPMDDFLEISREVAKFSEVHGRPVVDACEEYRRALATFARELIPRAYGIAEGSTVDADDLRRCGWDPAEPGPDRDDFW